MTEARRTITTADAIEVIFKARRESTIAQTSRAASRLPFIKVPNPSRSISQPLARAEFARETRVARVRSARSSEHLRGGRALRTLRPPGLPVNRLDLALDLLGFAVERLRREVDVEHQLVDDLDDLRGRAGVGVVAV